jgi:hypothetical protein
MAAAGPPGPAIDHHGARPTHADPAGKSVGKVGLQVALNPRHNIQDSLRAPRRHGITAIGAAGVIAAPNEDIQLPISIAHAASPWGIRYCRSNPQGDRMESANSWQRICAVLRNKIAQQVIK